jgi:hypothetical protein
MAVRVGGRPSVATEEIIRASRDLLPNPGRSITSITKLLGVSPGTLCNHIPDLRELRAADRPAPAPPATVSAQPAPAKPLPARGPTTRSDRRVHVVNEARCSGATARSRGVRYR